MLYCLTVKKFIVKNKKEILGFILKKFFKLITLLIALCIVTFILLEKSPLDPVQAYVGADLTVTQEQRENIAEYWGLNKPPLERFSSWFKAIAKGDLGRSMIYRRDVVDVISERFMASLALMLVAWVVSGVLGFILGIVGFVQGNDIQSINKCVNYGNVEAVDTSSGGIIGLGRRVNVSNCSNFGYVKCDVGRVGGIFGDAGYTVSIYNCFNAGHIYSDTSTAGSMAAHIDWGGIVSNNYNVGDIEGKDIYAISNHPGTTESKNNFFLEIQKQYMQKEGREIKIEEMAKILKTSKEEITLAMESYNPVESIHSSAYNKDGDEICILDRLSTNIDEETQIVNKISIKQLIEGLEDREKQIILLRYYKSRTQSQVAKILGITQVQVSRLEKQILETMKKKICK